MATRVVARHYDRALAPTGLTTNAYSLLSRLEREGAQTVVPRDAGRSDRAAAGRVRLVARDDLARDLARPPAVRIDGAVLGGADGPLRRAARDADRADDDRDRRLADDDHDRPLAAQPPLGRARRRRNWRGRGATRRRGREPLVLDPTRSRDRDPDGEQRERPDGVPAGARLARDRVRLAVGRRLGGGAGDGGRVSGGGGLRARPAAIDGAAAIRRAGAGRGARALEASVPPPGRRAAARLSLEDLLAPLAQLLHLRPLDERADRHASDPGGDRSPPDCGDGCVAARADGAVRRDRDDELRLADRPS